MENPSLVAASRPPRRFGNATEVLPGALQIILVDSKTGRYKVASEALRTPSAVAIATSPATVRGPRATPVPARLSPAPACIHCTAHRPRLRLAAAHARRAEHDGRAVRAQC